MDRDHDNEWDGKYVLEIEDKGFAALKVDMDYYKKHTPEAGGYYVGYEGGYKSYSPAKAFEAGYTKI